jgi:hypothetical protein
MDGPPGQGHNGKIEWEHKMNQRRECARADLGSETPRLTPKPFGRALCHESLVPEGHSTIAQRFNAGWESITELVPKGRPNFSPFLPSLRDLLGSFDVIPSVETLGYSHSSLRDGGKLLSHFGSRSILEVTRLTQ